MTDIPVIINWHKPYSSITTTPAPPFISSANGQISYDPRIPADLDVTFEADKIFPIELVMGKGPFLGRPLHQQIMDATTPDEVKELIRTVGPLRHYGFVDAKNLPKSDETAPGETPIGIRYDYRDFLYHRHKVILMAQTLSRTRLKMEDISQPDYITDFINEILLHQGGHRDARPISEGGSIGADIRIEVTYDQELGGLATSFIASEPLTLAFFEIMQSFAAGAEFKTCDFCGQIFGAGHGRSRAIQSKYCSDNHRSYHKRKMAAEAGATMRTPKPRSRGARAAKAEKDA